MEKKRGMLILTGLLVILLLVYSGLCMWNARMEEKKAAQNEADTVYVTETDSSDIVSMMLQTGEELSFQKDGDRWYYTPDSDFPLDQSYPEKIAETLAEIKAERKLTDGDTMADYGLDTPVYTVSYEMSDGSRTVVYFGNETGNCYYVTVEGGDAVYTVESTVLESLQYSLPDLAQLDEYPSIGSGNLVKEVITQNGETVVYDSENENQQEDIAAVAGGLGAVSLSEAADYSVEDEDLDDFGLDEDSRITVEVTYTKDEAENVLVLYIGGEDGEGNRYVMLNDSRIVYVISDEIVGNILNEEDE